MEFKLPVQVKETTLWSFLRKNLESAEFTNKKQNTASLHSLIAKHVLGLSNFSQFQCIRFEKKHCFALVVLNWLLVCF